jgi:thiosulfate/3-mercaptopyruvate sulfurtransferase
VAPLEPQKKVLVNSEFLKTPCGEPACVDCHNGDSSTDDKEDAHKGMDPFPSINNPDKACGTCHDDIVKTAKNSLHATLSTFPTVIKTRSDMSKWKQIDKGRESHCAACHTSCGGCHVSRPKYVKKGFIDGHIFRKRPDSMNQCIACHGSRVANDYIGVRGQGDVHAAKHNMGCMGCHDAAEMHAAAPEGLKGRYHLKEKVQCVDCHKDLEYGSVREHRMHIRKVQCQVCHSQPYTNCWSCHTGRDDKGLAYFANQKDTEGFKIGLNYDRSAPGASYFYMLVRHVPVDPKLFDYYAKDALAKFDNTPTWKRTSPHNIQRKTWQAATCNNCHGNRELFLDKKDLLDYEVKANRNVVVPDERVPKKIRKTKKIKIDISGVRHNMLVTAKWLKRNLGKKGLVVVDARESAAYDKGHIKGAINVDSFGLRESWEADRSFKLFPPEKLAKIFGNAGIAANDHIVVYHAESVLAGWVISVLEYMGATNVSMLNGGLEVWRDAGYKLTDKKPSVTPKKFELNLQTKLAASNEFLARNLDNPRVAVVDIRSIDQSKGVSKHPRALRPGKIPGSINVPFGTFYVHGGPLKSPEELLWTLNNYGITKDKTVIVTCNTNFTAGGGMFLFRYLGYPNVKVHGDSWVGWTRWMEYIKKRLQK